MRKTEKEQSFAFGGKQIRAAKVLLGLPAVLLFAAGCGSVGLPLSVGAPLALQAERSTIDTNETDQFSATLASGAPAAVKWSIAGGDNDASIGQGSISAKGAYTPPRLLSRDTMTVEIRAALESDPATEATFPITVTPGFVQSLTPENASLAPGGTVQLTGEIAEVNSGSINWSLATSAKGTPPVGEHYGSISGASCRHSSRTYTYCTATYTAPPSLPPSVSVYVLGSVSVNPDSIASLHVLLNGTGYNSSALQNQMVQAGTVEMGSSGGNANDYDESQTASGEQYVNDCCGGTLGALVQDRNDNQYILSNNHVLAESDQARIGDTIVQPALIDLNCNPQAGRAIGSLRYVVPIESAQTNVDAALAAATPAVDPTGGILQLGNPVNGLLSSAAPAGGTGEVLTAGDLNQVKVVKSGRTTGLTCSTVDTLNLSVEVDYYYDCAETKPYYTKTYTNQIGIPGMSFADSGDSGALVLDASNAQPIGLFFASGSGNDGNGFSVANPIQDVLTELGQKSQADRQQFQIVGGAPHPITCSNYDQNNEAGPEPPLSAAQRAAARSAADTAGAILTRPDNSVLGVATGRSQDAPYEAAVIVYVDKSKGNVAVPKSVAGVRTLVIPTDAASVNAGTAPTTLPTIEGIHLRQDVLRTAANVQQQFAPILMSDPAFFGVGVTQSRDNPQEAALLVLVDPTKTPLATPDMIGSLRVRYMTMNRLHVTRSKFPGTAQQTSCELPLERRQSPQ